MHQISFAANKRLPPNQNSEKDAGPGSPLPVHSGSSSWRRTAPLRSRVLVGEQRILCFEYLRAGVVFWLNGRHPYQALMMLCSGPYLNPVMLVASFSPTTRMSCSR